ncbi:hypothetical protein BDN70DRAFT_902304 [Pholiota conissans]|uniref:Uncharacterized protein n=1 Tax=Pholiota conissans TaxID=109636 RepID=A0A9P5YK21_9AGAR|nr:hypothetical protein BDN70DRAFT_902304 [Pholiota conissans]
MGDRARTIGSEENAKRGGKASGRGGRTTGKEDRRRATQEDGGRARRMVQPPPTASCGRGSDDNDGCDGWRVGRRKVGVRKGEDVWVTKASEDVHRGSVDDDGWAMMERVDGEECGEHERGEGGQAVKERASKEMRESGRARREQERRGRAEGRGRSPVLACPLVLTSLAISFCHPLPPLPPSSITFLSFMPSPLALVSLFLHLGGLNEGPGGGEYGAGPGCRWETAMARIGTAPRAASAAVFGQCQC